MSAIREIGPEQARRLQQAGGLLVDVRDPNEHELGIPGGALPVPRPLLVAEPEK